MAETSLAVETNALRKEYGKRVAVQGLSLRVERGEIFGFLGPNGAGKTTTIKMLLGLVQPTTGQATLLGEPITSPKARRRVGYLPEHFRFHDWLRADEFLDLHGRLAGVPRDVRMRRAPELLELVGLTAATHQTLGTFSKGMLQRVGLAQALMNDPELIFLDEPTSGLDPMGRRLVRDVIHRLAERGTTVFLNSHLLSEVEVTCTRVGFITKGTLRETVPLRDAWEGLVRVTLRVGAVDEGLREGLRRWGRLSEDSPDGQTVTLDVEEEHCLPEIARWIVARGTDLYSMAPQRLSLEDLFVSIVGSDRSWETS
ncbi:MAG: ABC transporter ATP-binding protein [Anaerolineae bacterium]